MRNFSAGFEDPELGRHRGAAADDDAEIDQHRPQFTRHDGHQQRTEQLG